MGRPKGFVVTEEQKIAMKEGRIAARQIRAAAKALDVDKKPTIVINGQEEDGFDFWPAIRNSMRPIHKYQLCKVIEREVADPKIYNNVRFVLDILEKYFIISETGKKKIKKERKERKKSTYVMTEEHKKKIQEGRRKNK